jgi:hypothetical protein
MGPKYGQLATCYDTDAAAAFRTVGEDTITELVLCGPDVDEHVAAARKFTEAGFTHVALVQVGGDQQDRFISWAEHELLPLRKPR